MRTVAGSLVSSVATGVRFNEAFPPATRPTSLAMGPSSRRNDSLRFACMFLQKCRTRSAPKTCTRNSPVPFRLRPKAALGILLCMCGCTPTECQRRRFSPEPQAYFCGFSVPNQGRCHSTCPSNMVTLIPPEWQGPLGISVKPFSCTKSS